MLERLAAGRRQTLVFLEDKRARDLSRWRWPHLFFGSLSGYQWFKRIGHHEIRHAKQTREIARQLRAN